MLCNCNTIAYENKKCTCNFWFDLLTHFDMTDLLSTINLKTEHIPLHYKGNRFFGLGKLFGQISFHAVYNERH